MKKLTILAGLFLVPTFAIASNWVALVEGDSEKFLIDSESIVSDGGLTTAWDEYIYTEDQPSITSSKKPYNLVKSLNVFDCKHRAMDVKQVVYYHDREVVNSATFRGPIKWSAVVPDSMGDTELNYVCKKHAKEHRSH